MSEFNQMTNSVPSPSGAMTVPEPGIVSRAIGGLGATVEGIGSFLTQQGIEAEQKTKRLDQIRQTANQTLDIAEKLNTFHDSLRSDPNLDGYDKRFGELQDQIRQQVAEIPDQTVRTQVEADLSQRLPMYQKAMMSYRQEARINQFQQDLPAMKAQSLQLGDETPFVQTLDALRDSNLISPQDHDFQAQEMRTLITKKNESDQLLATARKLGPDAWDSWVSDEKNVQGLTLDTKELTQVKDQASNYFQSQRDSAAIALRKQTLQQQSTDADWLGAFYANKIGTDPRYPLDAVPDLIATQALSPATGKAILEGIAKGPRAQNDPAAFQTLHDNLNSLAMGRMTQQDAYDALKANAGKITKEEYERQTAKIADYATIQNQALNYQQTWMLRTFQPIKDTEIEVAKGQVDDYVTTNKDSPLYPKYLAAKKHYDDLVEQQALGNRRAELGVLMLDRWVRAHPEAEPQDIQEQALIIKTQIMPYTPVQIGEGLKPTPPPAPSLTPYRGMNPVGQFMREGLTASIPVGLESIWPKLSDADKADAVKAISMGHSPEELVRLFQQSSSPSGPRIQRGAK
jgi:hypothetical protein